MFDNKSTGSIKVTIQVPFGWAVKGTLTAKGGLQGVAITFRDITFDIGIIAKNKIDSLLLLLI